MKRVLMIGLLGLGAFGGVYPTGFLFPRVERLAVAADPPRAPVKVRRIPQPSREQLERRHRDELEWNRRTLVGAYDRVGKKNPRWDADARAALEALARVVCKD